MSKDPLPLTPPLDPMLASPGLTEVPDIAPNTAAFEPKWDGFRAIVFKNGDDVVIQGRNGADLAYAFPEMVAAFRATLPARIVLDGELIIVQDGRLQFEALGARLRPRSEEGGESIARLARQTPASFVAFDLLALGDESLMAAPYRERRERLVGVPLPSSAPVFITAATDDIATAREWFTRFEGAGLDGLIVKSYADHYAPGKRTLTKIKHQRTLDAVVAGWREHSSGSGVGSLLLGLYDDQGRLHHIGVASGFSAKLRTQLIADIASVTSDGSSHPWIDAAADVRAPGGVNRWSKGRSASWTPLAPDLVVEVRYDAFEGDRLRHVGTLMRWRPDREPSSCTFSQVDRPPLMEVSEVLSLGPG